MEIKVEKGNFTTTFNDIFNAEVDGVKLGPEAWGLYIYMLSLPEDWDFTIRGLASVINAGVNKIQRILKELELAGFIERNQPFKDGKFGKIQYTILTIPKKVKNTNKINNRNTNKNNKNKPLKSEKIEKLEVEPCTQNPYTENSDTKQNTKEQKIYVDKLKIKANFLPDSNHFLTNELIEKKVIDIFDYKLKDFNSYFSSLDQDFEIDIVLEATRYVISWYLKTKPEINSLYDWLTTAITNNAIKLKKRENDSNTITKAELKDLGFEFEDNECDNLTPTQNWLKEYIKN